MIVLMQCKDPRSLPETLWQSDRKDPFGVHSAFVGNQQGHPQVLCSIGVPALQHTFCTGAGTVLPQVQTVCTVLLLGIFSFKLGSLEQNTKCNV